MRRAPNCYRLGMRSALFIAAVGIVVSGVACGAQAPSVKTSNAPAPADDKPPAHTVANDDAPPTPTVTGKEARAMVAAGAKLIDVRSAEEFAEGHIDGASHIPVDTIEEKFTVVGAKDQPMVLYCRRGIRAQRAAEALRAAGYSRVETLGAMSNWDE